MAGNNMNDLTLYNGSVLSYDAAEHAFHGRFDWCGQPVEFALVTPPNDKNGLGAMQYTFEKLYSNREHWNEVLWKALGDKLLPLLNNAAGGDMEFDAEALPSMLTLIHIAIIYTGDVHVFAPGGVRIEAVFMLNPAESEDEPYADIDITYCLAGTLEDGFDELYSDSYPVLSEDELPSYTLSTGDEIPYSPLMGTYTGEIELLGSTVELFIEPDDEMKGADKAFDMLEKAIGDAESYDILARRVIRKQLDEEISNMREVFNIPTLEVEDIMNDLVLSILVLDCDGGMEFAYETSDQIEARLTAIGNDQTGFTHAMIEDISDEE